MNASMKKTVAGTLAAVTLAFAVFAAAPASAGPVAASSQLGLGTVRRRWRDRPRHRRRDRLAGLRLHSLPAGLRPLGQLHRRSPGQRLLLTVGRDMNAPAI